MHVLLSSCGHLCVTEPLLPGGGRLRSRWLSDITFTPAAARHGVTGQNHLQPHAPWPGLSIALTNLVRAPCLIIAPSPQHASRPSSFHAALAACCAQAFPHPLARLNVVADTSMTGLRNQLSYSVVNEMVFSGLSHMINKFRRDVLQLPALRLADHGASMLETNRVRCSALPSLRGLAGCKAAWPHVLPSLGSLQLPA